MSRFSRLLAGALLLICAAPLFAQLAPTDLALSVTPPAATPKAGTEFLLAVSVSNLGTATASSPIVKFSYPVYFYFPEPGWYCQISSDISSTQCRIRDLAPGETLSASLRAFGASFDSSATINSSVSMANTDSNAANNSVNLFIPFDTHPVLEASLYCPSPALLNAPDRCSFTIATDGPAARNFTFSYDVPPNTVLETQPPDDGPLHCTLTSPGHVSCTADTLLGGVSPSSGPVMYQVTLSPKTTQPGTVTHTVTVNAANAVAPVTVSRTVSVSAIAIPLELHLLLHGSAGVVENSSFSLYNNSIWDAENVTADFTIPDGATYLGTTDGTCPTTHCTLGRIGALQGVSKTFMIRFPSITGLVAVGMSVTGTGVFPVSDSNNVQLAAPHLTSSLTPSATRVSPGTDIDFTLMLGNDGGLGAGTVNVTAALPSSLQLVSASSPNGNCQRPPQLSCTLTPLDAGSSATIHFTARAVSSGTSTVNVTAAAGIFSSTTATATVNVNDTTSVLTTTLVADRDTVAPGDHVAYTMRVTNAGPDNASAVISTLALQNAASIDAIDSTFTSCRVSLPTVVCQMQLLGAGATATAKITVRAPASAGVMSARATTSATNVPGDAVVVTTPVVQSGAADLAVSADVARGGIPTQPLALHFIVANTGGSDAAATTFDASLSSGLTLLSMTSTRGTCTATHCAIGTLSSGASADVTVTVSAAHSGSESVRGAAATSTAQSSTSNDAAQTAITVMAPRSRAVRH